ncbi:MAG: DUF512 domain-containing protein [Thermosulfidibacteraceae bacterium]|jgi:putative radical SAM enzyme (TIGR03279 family)
MGVKVVSISRNSIFYKAGLRKGDSIVAINGKEVVDVIDLMFYKGESVSLKVKRDKGTFELNFNDFDYGGVEFEELKAIPCRLRCLFCFMDQMPKGLRSSLYFKDDDYRLSFLYGNYITLTNLKERDLIRIKEYNLSPLFVSVHSTIPSIRSFMMGSERAGEIINDLKKLSKYCKFIHTQVVLCPGINDGYSLEKTILDLADMFPFVRSVAVVPVGVTKYRDGLFPIKPVGKGDAIEVLKTLLSYGERFLRDLGTRFVFPADELFIKAGLDLPPPDFYEDFCQMDDGVGMISYFLSRVRRYGRKRKLRVTLVTGGMFSPYLDRALKMANFSDYQILPIKNRFFGRYVNVTGLIAGKDIIETVKRQALYKDIWIPDVIFNDDGLTIDDMNKLEIQTCLPRHVTVVPSDIDSFLDFVS